MSIDIATLKRDGKDVTVTKPHSAVQGKVLAIVRKHTKAGEGLTQKEVAGELGKMLGKDVAPQQARSALKALDKKGKVVRRYMEKPDETGNRVFWYSI